MDALLPTLTGDLLRDASLFRRVNDLARATPWLHEPARLYATYGAVLLAALPSASRAPVDVRQCPSGRR